MWEVVRQLKEDGVTIILTAHYIEEAEAMADRIAVINGGRILLIEEKEALMRRMGRKEMRIELREPVARVPSALEAFGLTLDETGSWLTYTYDTQADRTGIVRLLTALQEAGLRLADVETKQSSLEEIFVGLVKEGAEA